MPTLFGSDRVLMYDVYPWNQLGFGVPNFGDNIGTKSQPIWGLVDEVGQVQLFIMSHIDAQRKQPPSRNTVERIGKVINRVNTILAGRAKDTNEVRLEEGHATAAPEIWNIHPCPFFDGPIVRNRWLKEYNRLTMIALTNAMQHSDNNLALTVTSAFARQVWPYFREIKILMGSELLLIPKVDLIKDEFLFTTAHYDAYKPENVVVNIEALDSPGQIFSALTEDDLRPLLDGIPANLIAPNLKQYPIGPLPDSSGLSGEALTPAAATVGYETAKAAAGGTVGRPGDTAPSGAGVEATGAIANSGGSIGHPLI